MAQPTRERRARRRDPVEQRPRRLRRWLPRLALAGLLGAVLAVGALLLYASKVPLPPEDVPPTTTIVFASDGETRLASLDEGESRTTVRLQQVPPVLRDAVLAAEDRKFYEHGGVDPFGIVRALWADVRGKGVRQGGSTITQQYVKDVYVGRDRTLGRKLREAVLAVKVEQRLSKDQILERYLNRVYFGRGAYGVQAASRAWFAKPVEEVGPQEAAYLAALIRSPEGGDVRRNPEQALRRRDGVVDAMVRLGTLPADQGEVVKATPIETYVVRREDRPPTITNAEVGVAYVVDEVRRQLVEEYGEAVALGGGLRITTSIDLGKQRKAYEAVYGEGRQALKPQEPSGALVSIDDQGRIVALVGGRDHAQSQVNLALGKRGGGSGRLAGSTFKPFALAAVVDQGFTVQSAFPAPKTYTWEGGDEGRDYEVRNFEGEAFPGSMDLVDATRQSVNTVYAQVARAIGPEDVAEMGERLGVSVDLQPRASLVFGAQEVAPLDMAAAYSTLANEGERVRPRLITRVRNASGEELQGDRPERERVLEQRTARIVNHVLRKGVEDGTGVNARIDRPAAGKTGTTNENTDAWFVGYTAGPRLTTAVWVGWADDGSRPMSRVRGGPVNGGGLPAQIWKAYMAAAVEGAPAGDFPDPGDLSDGKVLKGATARSTATSTTVARSSTSSSSAPSSTTSTTAPAATTTTTAPRATTSTTERPAATTPTTRPATTTTARPTTTTTPAVADAGGDRGGGGRDGGG